MAVPRSPRTSPARRLIAAGLSALLALGGGTALILATAQSASAAPGDVFFDTLEDTPIPHSPFLFTGQASPGDAVTITSSYGNDCHAIADGGGEWSCNMTFTGSVETTVITVSRDTPDADPFNQESDGQEHHIALPLSITETSADEYRANTSPPTLIGTGAIPGVAITGNIGGSACSGVGAGDGSWTCVAGALGEGSYVSSVQQDAGSVISDASLTTYVADFTTTMPVSAQPYDSSAVPINIQTSQRQPVFSGNPGSAEPGATVHVLASDFGTTPIVHGGTPAFDPYCNATVANDGSWSCQGPQMSIGHFWEVSFYAVDDLGNVGPSPDDEFGIEILPPPDAPTVINPTPGLAKIGPFDIDGTVDSATASVSVIADGGTVLCGGPVVPVGLTFDCGAPVNFGPGPHTIDITAYDIYETGTGATVNIDSWGPPVLDTPTVAFETSASTIELSGESPVGADVSVRVDGVVQAGCSGIVTGIPEWDCTSGFVAVGPHTVDVDYVDLFGTTSATVSRGFDIVPTLPAPVFTAPTVGYSSTDRSVHVAMTNQPEGTVYVREGLTNLCPPTPVGVGTYSCDTIDLSVGTHTITISQTDAYDVMSASAHRTVTILPTPGLPLTMKTFGFSFTVLDENGEEIGSDGIGTGDMLTIVASGVPPGTIVQTEIHSDPVALGGMTVGQTGLMRLTTTVPAVPPGEHEIVVAASAPGYWPGTFTTPIQVHGLKQIPPADEEIVKELGDPDPVKELGDPEDASATGPGGAGGSGDHGFEDPSVFGTSLESPYNAPAHAFALSPAGLVLSGSIAIAFLLLVGFPAELLESTIRSNYDRAFGWLARLRRRVGRIVAPLARALANPWVGSGLTILAAAFLLGFADPDFGPNGASVRLLLAMIVAVLAINVGLALIVMKVAGRAFDVAALLKPMPAALIIVGVSVLVSRLAGISPGFLFGVVLGVAYARELKLRDEARLGVLGVGLTIAAGLIAWLGYGIATAIASGPGFFNNLIIEVLAAITLEALGTLVIALLPIEFLDGRTIFRWSKLAWLASYAVTLLVFLFVVVPLSDNWGTMSAPILGWGTLFAVFAAVAIVTWAIFRRRSRATPSSPEAATPQQRVQR